MKKRKVATSTEVEKLSSCAYRYTMSSAQAAVTEGVLQNVILSCMGFALSVVQSSKKCSSPQYQHDHSWLRLVMCVVITQPVLPAPVPSVLGVSLVFLSGFCFPKTWSDNTLASHATKEVKSLNRTSPYESLIFTAFLFHRSCMSQGSLSWVILITLGWSSCDDAPLATVEP